MMMAILQKVMLQRLKTDSGNLLTHTGFIFLLIFG